MQWWRHAENSNASSRPAELGTIGCAACMLSQPFLAQTPGDGRQVAPTRLSVPVGAHGAHHQARAAPPTLLQAGRLHLAMDASLEVRKSCQGGGPCAAAGTPPGWPPETWSNRCQAGSQGELPWGLDQVRHVGMRAVLPYPFLESCQPRLLSHPCLLALACMRTRWGMAARPAAPAPSPHRMPAARACIAPEGREGGGLRDRCRAVDGCW